MNTNRVLAGELLVSLGFSSWAAIKSRQAPWPPNIVYTCVAFGILGAFSFVSQELAATLGAGFLLAQLIKVMGNKDPYTGGVPKLVDTGGSALVPNKGSTNGTNSTWHVITF